MVTGAGAGIGEACTRLFASQAAKVVAVDIDEERLKWVCGDIGESGGEAVAVRADVTDGTNLDRAFEICAKTFGPLDVLVNNAGGGLSTDFFAISEDEWNRVIELNLTSVFMVSQRAAAIFRDRRSGWYHKHVFTGWAIGQCKRLSTLYGWQDWDVGINAASGKAPGPLQC